MLDAAVPLTAVGTVLGATYYHDMGTPRRAAIALSVAACLALVGRRRFPAATVAITAMLAIPVLAVDREMAPYALLVPAVALFSLALLGSRAWQLVGAVGCMVVTVAAEELNPHRPGLLFSAQHLILLTGPILAIEVSRTRGAYRSEVGQRLALVKLTREQEAQRRVTAERLRIARDLHDVIAHTLTTINVQASVAGHLLDSRPEQARHALSVIEEASRDGIGELRAILGVLRDPDCVAARAPAPGLDEVPDLMEQARTAGLRAQLDVTGQAPARVPEAVSLAAYRIVQESLTNVARHTHGAGVQVRLSFTDQELGIAVENTVNRTRRVNGADVPRPEPAFGGGTPRVGILGMTERAEALGGTLTTTASATGFLVHARLPYRAG
jgi:signal transduction histidine kinase